MLNIFSCAYLPSGFEMFTSESSLPIIYSYSNMLPGGIIGMEKI